MPNRLNHNLNVISANSNIQQQNLLTKANEKHTAIQTATEATNSKLDTLSGAINNNLGDAQVKLQTYVYAHDSGNGQAKPLQCDSNGHLKVSNDVLEVSAETINLSTDTLETKIQATNDKLDSFSGAGNNNIGEGQTKLQTYLYARDVGNGNFKPLVCDSDAHLQVDCLTNALPTGAATESTLSSVKTSVELIDDVVTAQNAAHPSKANAVGGRYYVDNTFRDVRVDTDGKVIIDSPAGSDINTRLDAITTGQTSGTQQAKIMGSESGHPSGQQRQIHCDGSGNLLTSIVSSVNVIPANSVNSHITDDPANSMAVGLKARTTQGTATSEEFLVSSNGSLNVINKTGIVNNSEVSYISGQSISGSGSFEGSSISVDPNTKAFYAEFNFSHTGIKFEVLASLDGSNFFSTNVEFNTGGMTPATLTGLETILGTSTSISTSAFPPFIKFKFSNSDSSAQTATLSYVQQIG